MAACPDAKEYQEKCVVQWLPNMRKKYPKVKSDSSAALTIKEVLWLCLLFIIELTLEKRSKFQSLTTLSNMFVMF